jgi:hypothetical protein
MNTSGVNQVIYKFLRLIIQQNGVWDKDFNLTLLSKMVYGLSGIEIDLGKSIADQT